MSKSLKKCIICNEEFIPVRKTSKVCNKEHYRKCSICGNLFLLKTNKHLKDQINRDYCYNRECREKSSLIKRKNTLIEKYGVDNPLKLDIIKQKVKDTKLERYNDSSYNNRYKSKQTCIERYGVLNYVNSDEFKLKSKETNLSKYGTNYYFGSDSFKSKAKQSNIAKYGAPYYCMTKEARSSIRCISRINKSISNKLFNLGFKNEFEFRLQNYSYDLHILDTNILIEIDPTPYHNIINHPFNEPKDKYYHYNKTKLALENNYICIHKFDWIMKEDLINILLNIKDKEIVQGQPRLHWYNMKTRKHLKDFNESYNKQEMVDLGYVGVYDDGIILKGSDLYE